jgi:hypothetical protein
MRGLLKITYHDNTSEYFDVNPIGDHPNFAANMETFINSPNVALVLDGEILIIPGASIRQISITRTEEMPLQELDTIPGVVVGVKRVVG